MLLTFERTVRFLNIPCTHELDSEAAVLVREAYRCGIKYGIPSRLEVPAPDNSRILKGFT